MKESLFENPGLGVCSIKKGEVAKGRLLAAPRVNLADDKLGFVKTVSGGIDFYFCPTFFFGPELKYWVRFIFRNNNIGRIQNCLGRAVILFKINNFDVRVITD